MVPTSNDLVNKLFDTNWMDETMQLCRLNTIRLDNDKVNPNVLSCRDIILGLTKSFNMTQRRDKFVPFSWAQSYAGTTSFKPSDDEILAAQYSLFGLRLGSDDAPYKLAVICHLDTVPASADDGVWDPFHPFTEPREYPDGNEPTDEQDFLVGRGCIDDKGPAISAFIVVRALAKRFDGMRIFGDDVALEILFDTSEETDMATPHYLEDPLSKAPHFGIVFDAFWCTRAEKGAERPIFYVSPPSAPSSPSEPIQTAPLTIASLISNPGNSTNTIPDWAEAVVTSDNEEALVNFEQTVQARYRAYKFPDDDGYERAELIVKNENGAVVLRTTVKGAQHGSMPQENRKDGWNPLVSLTNFLGGLVHDGTFVPNEQAGMCAFITWIWGTKVFGEGHPDLLEESDDVFTDKEITGGTTYAVTRVTEVDLKEEKNGDGEMNNADKKKTSKLELDIRYALGHHSVEWDEVSEGYVGEGEPSTFQTVFGTLVDKFNASHENLPTVTFETVTVFAPDIRVPSTNENFQKVEKAFEEVTGNKAKRWAIGGGTDAKGVVTLLAVGPLFHPMMGPPVNYHGISEAAPVADMRTSTAILYRILELEVEEVKSRDLALYEKRRKAAIHSIRKAHARGFKYFCSC